MIIKARNREELDASTAIWTSYLESLCCCRSSDIQVLRKWTIETFMNSLRISALSDELLRKEYEAQIPLTLLLQLLQLHFSLAIMKKN